MFLLGIKHCSFESLTWKRSREQRMCYLKHILDTELLISRTKEEIVELLGDEYNHYYVDRWKYFVHDLKTIPYKMYLEIEFRNNTVSDCKVRLV
ncbi:hypothetical protein DN748_00890 [Sinomicrobium soli]|nr:hypothetical protein DN748_00890 [Sinomicrobium sp. N-1-3-6]